MKHAARLVALLVALGSPALMVARAEGQDQNQPGQAQPKRPKVPPPPLFPKHRRGIYKDSSGLSVIDATPQSPPLDTDDPGVPDKGEYEINVTSHLDHATDVQRVDILFLDANYGLLPTIAGYKLPTQLKFEVPVAARRESGHPYTVGIGAANVGLKFNFYTDEHRGISVSVYPQVEFATLGTRAFENGLAEDGQTVILPLLVSKEFHYLTFVANAGLEKPLHDPGRDMTTVLGLGFGRALTRKVAAMIEIRSESTLDFRRDRLVLINGGLIHGVRNVVVYTNIGHSLLSDDGSGHSFFGIGMKLTIQTRQRPDK